MPTVIKGRYEVIQALGSGGEARVVKALDRQHGRFVALKIRRVSDSAVRDELLGEARVLLAVPPHSALPLVREDFFDGDDYIVAMDWVDGIDLATLVRDRGRPGLAPSSVLAYLAQAAEALTHLHSQSPAVIHGDVKPANLIVTQDGRIKLVDFGLSSAPHMPRWRTGTPGYRAPELAVGEAPSRASDVYALAASAFALLTGSAPAGILPDWEGIDPAQAEQLEAAIRLGMATDPARRPASPGELVERLRSGWAAGLPTGVVTLCLSDIDGSTALWESDPEAMATSLVRHEELIAAAVAAHGGSVVQAMGEGDSAVSVFDSASSAVEAAIAANRALAAEDWPPGISIAVRWGLHTGETERAGTEYRGTTIIVAARLRAQADGGQVFLSSVTSELVAAHLPAGYGLVDLGPHRLKGLAAPERISALKGPGVNTPLPGTECPYRGLLAFEADDRGFFFGREGVVADILARLAPGRLLAVVGASGSGKSSVLRAGVFAAVRAGEAPGLTAVSLVTPGVEPSLEVPDEPDRLVIVDQFEELFTLCGDAERRQAFVDDLLGLRCAVAIGVRADLYGRLSVHSALARVVADNHVLLGAMSDKELERAVTEPARLAGIKLEAGLVDLVLRDVATEPGALPLLSHALRATWERRDGRTLTVEGYRDSGGVAAAVAQTADDVVGSLSPDRRQLTRSVFLRLTELGDGIAETRRRVAIDDLVPEGASPAIVAELLEELAEARLVTLDEGTAEVAHEVLIREWPTLRGWLDEDREGIRLHRELGGAARMWEIGGQQASDLYRGPRLAAAVEWSRTHRDDLNAGERSFIDASTSEADREHRSQVRINRRLRGLLAGAVILLAVAVVAGVVAVAQRDHARSQALTSDAERIGAQALTEPDVDRSLLLAVAGVRLQSRVETRSDLLAELQRNPALIHFARPFSDLLDAVEASPDGRLFAVADSAGAVRFIDLATWKPIGAAVLLGSPVAPRAMSFSPDGRTLMVVTVDSNRSQLDAIDVASRRIRHLQIWRNAVPLPPLGSDGVAYSPDGKDLAVSLITEAPDDDTPTAERLLLLDAATGRIRWQRQYPMSEGQAEPHVTFTPTGELLTSAQQGATILWNARTGQIIRIFPVGGLPAISRDGQEVALGRNSASAVTLRSWMTVLDLRTGRYRTLAANLPAAWIRGLAFTPDGSRIVADAFDGVHVWDVASGTIEASYVGEPGPRSVMALSPTGATAIIGFQDGSVAAFDVSGAGRLGREFSWGDPDNSCFGTFGTCDAVNSSSDLLADAQANGGVALVSLRTLRLTRVLPEQDGTGAQALSFLPDGRTVIDGGPNGHVTFWNASTGKVTRTLHFADPVGLTAPSPNGKLLAVQTEPPGSQDSRVEVVQIATGKVLQIHTVPDGTTQAGGLEFSRDGRELAAIGCCDPGSVVVAWDTRSGRQLFSRHPPEHATSLDIAPDSRLIAVGTEDGRVLFLGARSGQTLQPPLQADAGNIFNVSFSPDGRSFVVGAVDNSASVWSLDARERLGNPFASAPGVIPIALFEPDGQLLVIQLENAVQWPTDVKTWERFACRAAGRNLTRAEWHDLLPNRPYVQVCPAAA